MKKKERQFMIIHKATAVALETELAILSREGWEVCGGLATSPGFNGTAFSVLLIKDA